MKFSDSFNISEKKVKALLQRIEDMEIDLQDIDETFVRGSGKGGQKINKTSSCVVLFHSPTSIRIKCQKERDRNKNRFLALRELVDQIEAKLFPEKSKKVQDAKKRLKQKLRRKRKSKAKY